MADSKDDVKIQRSLWESFLLESSVKETSANSNMDVSSVNYHQLNKSRVSATELEGASEKHSALSKLLRIAFELIDLTNRKSSEH